MSKTRACKTAWDTSIRDGALYFEDVRQCSMRDDSFVEMLEDKNLKAIRIISLQHDWNVNVHYTTDTAKPEQLNLEMTLRKERRGTSDHWYAYRRVFGKLHKRYVGRSEQITEYRLVDIAFKMPSL